MILMISNIVLSGLLSSMSYQLGVEEIEGYKLTGVREYTYNEKNERTGKLIYDAEKNLTAFVYYLYDLNGNKIETLKYNGDSVLIARYVYIYNKNLKIKFFKFDFEKQEESVRLYKHNEKGQIIRTEYFSNNKLTRYVDATFTVKGEYENRKTYDAEDKLKYESKYRYVYEQGKLIEKSRLSGSDKLQTKTTYTYNPDGSEAGYDRQYFSAKKDKKRRYRYNKNGQCIGLLVYESIEAK